MNTVMGVDAAAGEWLAVLLVDGSFAGADFQPSVRALLDRHPDVEVVAVDIPIHLPVGRTRPADEEAKLFVGGQRASSVFLTFPYEVLAAEPYEVALGEAHRLLRRELSKQGYALRVRIFEVDLLPKENPRVVEVHPEVSFRAMSGTPLRHSKHSWNGIAERRSLLAAAGILLPDDLPGGGRVAPDDVVDATVAAWSALRVAEGRSKTLPAVRPSDQSLGGVIHY